MPNTRNGRVIIFPIPTSGIEYVQQQTIANKRRLQEKDLGIRAKNNEGLRRTAGDPVAHRAYLLRASLIDSVRKRAAATA